MHLLKPKDAAIELVGVASPSFKSARLLDWGYGEGLEVMTPTTPMAFWKGRCLDFTPVGKDLIQLQGPTHPIALGEVVPIVLTFSDGSSLEVRPTYQASGPEHAADHPMD
jgi:copper(I)-binding protein